MKNMLIKYGFLSLAAMIALASCTKKDPPATNNTDTNTGTTGKVKMEFFNNVGGSSLNLGNQWYTNEHGDSFTVTKFNYYISNIVLNGPSVSYTESNSYHLVQQADAASQSFDMSDIPVGTYNSVTFTIGVDSAHNVSGAQTGALDPVNGMFWDWNTGYIMLKVEGSSPQSPNGLIEFHCGGFSGKNSVLRTVTLPLSSDISITSSNNNHIHLTADLLNMFKAPNLIDFSTIYGVTMPGTSAKMLADNYANLFTITYAGL